MWWKLWILRGSTKCPWLNRLVTHTDNGISCPVAEGLEEQALNSTTHGEWVNNNKGCPMRALTGLIKRKKERAKGQKGPNTAHFCLRHARFTVSCGFCTARCDQIATRSSHRQIVDRSPGSARAAAMEPTAWWEQIGGGGLGCRGLNRPEKRNAELAPLFLSLWCQLNFCLTIYYCAHMRPQRA